MTDHSKQGMRPHSLFGMIRHTNEVGGENVLSAYSDNAAVVAGHTAGRFSPDVSDRIWRFQDEPIHLLMKVETHNHPTAISPFAGAGTGAGGEIRDEGAVGRGSRPKAGPPWVWNRVQPRPRRESRLLPPCQRRQKAK